jgi:hypothetical protein
MVAYDSRLRRTLIVAETRLAMDAKLHLIGKAEECSVSALGEAWQL